MESSEMLYLYDEIDRADQKLSEAQKEVHTARIRAYPLLADCTGIAIASTL